MLRSDVEIMQEDIARLKVMESHRRQMTIEVDSSLSSEIDKLREAMVRQEAQKEVDSTALMGVLATMGEDFREINHRASRQRRDIGLVDKEVQ